MRISRRAHLKWWAAAPIASSLSASAENLPARSSWLPIPDVDLEVAAGSILDFSGLVGREPAGSYGWASALPNGEIAFKERQSPSRFFSASFQFAPSNGGFADKAEARRIVAQLVRTGYNAVRLQCVEANLMSGRKTDFDYDPVQFDRFNFFLAELKRNGIYAVIDVMYVDNGAYGNVFPHRWVKKFNLRTDVYVLPEAQEHWKQLLKTMLGTKNPYTGTVPLQDPAILCLVLSNEGGIIEMAFRGGKAWASPLPQIYEEPFKAWLTAKYVDEDRWRAAWGKLIERDESLSRHVRLPERMRESSVRHSDFMQFVVDLERKTYRWMRAYARELGFQGLTTSYNNWAWLHSDITRAALDAVDMHAYHSHPTGFVEPGSKVSGDSSIPGAAAYLRELTSSRQWGKPFLVTEYGQAFWNGYRREASALVPAYAALQGWNLLTQFSENSLQLSYAMPQPSRRAAIYPFTISTDPVRRTGERLAALLYARGDVASANGRLEYTVDSQKALERNGAWSQLAEVPSRMAFVTAVGLRIDATGVLESGARSKEFPGFFVDKSGVRHQILPESSAASRQRIGAAGVISDAEWAQFESGRYTSDTGELNLDTAKLRFAVNTKKTVVILTRSTKDDVGPFAVDGLSAPALLAASAMDGKAIENSRRILLFVLTDAVNTGMEFQDPARTVIRKLGALPALVQPVQFSFRLKLKTGGKYDLHALAQNGRRVQSLSVNHSSEGVQATIDTALLQNGPCLMFELVDE